MAVLELLEFGGGVLKAYEVVRNKLYQFIKDERSLLLNKKNLCLKA
jgi:hypothetical protein